MLTVSTPVSAGVGWIASLWRGGWNGGAVPSESADLVLLLASLAFVVLTVVVAATFAPDRPANARKQRWRGEGR